MNSSAVYLCVAFVLAITHKKSPCQILEGRAVIVQANAGRDYLARLLIRTITSVNMESSELGHVSNVNSRKPFVHFLRHEAGARYPRRRPPRERAHVRA